MGEKLVIGPINRGLRTDREPFVIDNYSFPTLINAYQWRGRVKRKRGTQQLGRLNRYLGTTDGSGNLTVTISPNPVGSGIITVTVGTDIFVDPGGASPVTMITNSSGSAVLTRSTGGLVITGSQVNMPVFYNPGLPVLGLEDLALISTQNPGTIAFDNVYSYNVSTTAPFPIYDVSFYKNPPTGVPGSYVQKSAATPLWWNGNTYQQFWTTNYQGALWATNGIDVPFTGTTIGMQFSGPSDISAVSVTSTTITMTIANCPLVIGDFVFLNEWTSVTASNAAKLNFQTGYVTACAPNTAPLATKTVTITLPNANVPADTYSPGIVQYLTTRRFTNKDCIRWYDGDPTTGVSPYPPSSTGPGWVNFMPPLSQGSYSIADQTAQQYYLVGARIILPFKGRLLFFGPVIQSSTGSPIYCQDTILYSQDGTPYYTASFNGIVSSPATTFNALLVPTNQVAAANSFFEDQTGYGGNISAGIAQPILTAAANRDVLIVGFNNLQTKVVFSGSDIVPFNFFVINSELGSGSTFSSIILDKGVITRGSRGFTIANEVGCERIDLDILDQAFEVNLNNNGSERFTAQRDFINEWIYMTYLSDQSNTGIYTYPNQTLIFNYRDNSWGIFNETYTTYGQFKQSSGYTWSSLPYKSWSSWDSPWISGQEQGFQPQIIAGNQQGFIMFKSDGTEEDESLAIQNISGSVITVPNHGLNTNDYFIINGVNGSVGAFVNGQIFQASAVTQNTITLINGIPSTGTYLGSGFVTRMYVPFIQTKQFPVAWGISRKTRLGPQQYFLSTTDNGQITLLIYLSQDASNAYSDGPIVPSIDTLNNSLIYSTVLYTCPESTNLGLTPANSSLQMIATPATGTSTQSQIWHRINTSLLGDTVQMGFTMSDAQMRSFIATPENFIITGASNAYPCVLTCTSSLSSGVMVQISGVQGMTQLNGNIYQVISASSSQVTINVDSSAFGGYISGGIATVMEMPNQFEEIELHSIILDVSPSQVLS